jgi:pimeloyl-ACP methyl ester carboxylesterase
MTYLNRADVSIWYEISGVGNLPLLLSNSFGGTTKLWAPNVEALAADRAVIRWDMRGHGRSDSPASQDAYTAAACVADMAAVLDAAGADRAVLGGLSLGGYLSLAFYRAHPDRVAALVLCDTGPGFRNDDARRQWNDRAYAQAGRLEADGKTGLARAARGMLAQADASVIDSVPKVGVPTLVLVGSQDAPFLGAASYLAAKIPGATHVVIEGAGHAANADAPEQFNRTVREFLATLTP